MRHPIIHKFISKLLNSPNSKGDYNYYFAIIKSKFIERACKRGNLELLKYFIIAKEYHVYQPLFLRMVAPLIEQRFTLQLCLTNWK
ncbi:hypothetical protein [Coxiella burnetii]|uniref:hypothetical protein n=1 Tax=Coxiella burnetii TaxID=777 RepID=UPI0000183553|nr:hypothetical protein [Coxiella burnetii]ABX77332.1 hypothetical protein COXBURSA331_A0236 [Coxiella burnetii RSA 331]AML47901.1 hypothetical protein AUR58_00970 [Coxiella burnetii]AML53929.1 hypothetical protein AYM38_00665 [Coxiella burnetii]ARI65059.1 hypothetical protein B7L74_00740 [Coxiella burnetii]ARK26559.1 hypothetical protein BMW92_00725 [Coxiella burnetii]